MPTPNPANAAVHPAVAPADDAGVHVVAIGASAGGLDALERFFRSLPAQSGAAYVVIQHLSPDHKSMMASLLARHTAMPVETVSDGMAIAVNRVYLIPPASVMHLAGRRLQLSPKSPNGITLPIDLFFTDLARAAGKRAIGIILSGTGSDGTRGALAINDAGGLVLAQDPETAKFDGMPRSVIATALVDAILPPEGLGLRVLGHIARAPQVHLSRSGSTNVSEPEAALEETLHLLHHDSGINFRDYKQATLIRRIERRMHVRQAADLESYVRLLDGDRTERAALQCELLIPVTSFFRDPEVFETLARDAVDVLVRERADNEQIRVWVPGTSTGEEAYSIAILFLEAFERARRWPDLKVFATDVEQLNLDTGSAGLFSEAIGAAVSPERLERFFAKRGSRFAIKNDIRQRIVFARHNLLEDPPFTRMDLVSCRNLLIYFRNQAQERVLRRLQYALRPNGFLLLGSSETLGDMQQDFAAVNARHKLFRMLRKVELPLRAASPILSCRGNRRPTAGRGLPGRSDAAAIEAGQAVLLRSYAPVSLLLTEQHELLHVFGDVSHYLRIGEGSVTLELARLLPPALAPVAQVLLYKSARRGESRSSDILHLERPDGSRERLRLVARPVPRDQGEGLLMLSIEPEPQTEPAGVGPAPPVLSLERARAERIDYLERELAVARESLQATIEELETTNEELQAVNEELMASNEELQSSNEELQSVNEELYTVNSENQEKIEILNRLNADLDGMAKAAAIATVFVDHELRLTRFTPEATALFNIRDSDIGRPIDDFTNRLALPRFFDELRGTIASGEMLQHEVPAADGRLYLARVLPYGAHESQPRGAVATFVDITLLREAEHLARGAVVSHNDLSGLGRAAGGLVDD